ncbi:DUF2829 domain-containing protein [Pseudomonas sp. GL-RE-26]|uniref:DUF2829 domain-containing protein n=1 Tax=Pseudomonas sp. GL-RE-26 TaxID=2832390 RepID=UPI001CBAF2EC|nr:DUF2829 domain-containing protein [Pseudomonas sp. GL-RE-26]
MNQRFIGTKIILALAMTRLAYNEYRGWDLPADENGADDGYLVEYTDGGAPNHPAHTGYISWSPKAQFDGAYRPVSGMSFGLAIEALKLGKRVTRSGWNGAGMWLEYRPASGVDLAFIRLSYPVHSKAYPDGARVSWAPSQTDMLADDWQLFD